jgi:hypothetical protein
MMRKLLLVPVALPLALAIGPELAAALWAPAIALLPLTAIVALASRKPPATSLFAANLAVVLAIGVLGGALDVAGRPGTAEGTSQSKRSSSGNRAVRPEVIAKRSGDRG